jgi:tetratricopeptide (TPR) repeat protein
MRIFFLLLIPTMAFADTNSDGDTILLRASELFVRASHESPEQALRSRLDGIKKMLELVDGADYADYPRMDEALFTLADEVTRMKHPELGRKYFKRLIKDYPNSKFVPDAYLVFGEYFFEQGELDNALKFYDKVLSYPMSRVAEYAQYKRGWAMYNLSNYNDALADFAGVARGINEKLAAQARRDAVLPYARVGQPAKARAFFLQIARNDVDDLMQRLADAYRGAGKMDECHALGDACN